MARPGPVHQQALDEARYIFRITEAGRPHSVPGNPVAKSNGEFPLPVPPQAIRPAQTARIAYMETKDGAVVDMQGASPPEWEISGQFLLTPCTVNGVTLDGYQFQRAFEDYIRYYLEENRKRAKAMRPLLTLEFHDTYARQHWTVVPVGVPLGERTTALPLHERWSIRLKGLRRLDAPPRKDALPRKRAVGDVTPAKDALERITTEGLSDPVLGELTTGYKEGLKAVLPEASPGSSTAVAWAQASQNLATLTHARTASRALRRTASALASAQEGFAYGLRGAVKGLAGSGGNLPPTPPGADIPTALSAQARTLKERGGLPLLENPPASSLDSLTHEDAKAQIVDDLVRQVLAPKSESADLLWEILERMATAPESVRSAPFGVGVLLPYLAHLACKGGWKRLTPIRLIEAVLGDMARETPSSPRM